MKQTGASGFVDTDDEAILVTDPSGDVRHGSARARRLLLLATASGINPASLESSMNERVAGALRVLATRLESAVRGGDAAPPALIFDTRWGRHVLRAYWLDDAHSLIGVRILRQEPMILRFIRAMSGLPLSPQQRRIALMIAEGRSNPEIATGLGLSGNTVAYHVKQLFLKLDVHDRAGAVSRIIAGGAAH